MDEFNVLLLVGACLVIMIRIMIEIEPKDKIHTIFTGVLGIITIIYFGFVYSYFKFPS